MALPLRNLDTVARTSSSPRSSSGARAGVPMIWDCPGNSASNNSCMRTQVTNNLNLEYTCWQHHRRAERIFGPSSARLRRCCLRSPCRPNRQVGHSGVLGVYNAYTIAVPMEETVRAFNWVIEKGWVCEISDASSPLMTLTVGALLGNF